MADDLTYWQRRQSQIQLLDLAESALRTVGGSQLRRRGCKQILTPTAILTPAWTFDRRGEHYLILRVKGHLSPVETGALHLAGVL